jgi:hypothetical protein
MGQSLSTTKKIPRVSQYCKDKHGPKAYYDRNACRKNGKSIEKITLKKFQNISIESENTNNKSKNNTKRMSKTFKRNKKTRRNK